MTDESEEFIVYYSRHYLLIFMLVSALVTVASPIAIYSVWLEGTSAAYLLKMSGYALVGILGAAATVYYRNQVCNPKPIARLSHQGVINENEILRNWNQVTRIHLFTGVLFIKTECDGDWFIRLDPAEIGTKQIRKLIEYIKASVPQHLTGEI